jgi:hypothetical protein
MRFSSLQSRSSFVACAALTLAPLAALAADSVSFSTASIELGRQRITVASTSKPEDFLAVAAALSNPATWRIQLNGSTVAVSEVLINARLLTVTVEYNPSFLQFTDVASIPKDQLKITFVPTSQTLTILTGKPAAAAVADLQKPNKCWNFALTEDKKNADIDISGGFQAGVGARPQYFWSVKASCPFDLGEGEKYGRLGPSFTAQAATQSAPHGNADPNSMKAGLSWNYVQSLDLSRNGFLYSADLIGYEFERAAKKEAVLDAHGNPVFQTYLNKDSNLIWDAMARYSYNGVNPLGVNFTLGFIGFEAGRSLTRTVHKTFQATNNQPIARLVFNFDVYKDFYSHGKTVLSLHGQQVLRLPLLGEPFQDADVNDGTKFLTTKPRHWSLIEANWLLAKGAGISLTYKRGSLPPGFEFVDHQVTLGLSVQFKR